MLALVELVGLNVGVRSIFACKGTVYDRAVAFGKTLICRNDLVNSPGIPDVLFGLNVISRPFCSSAESKTWKGRVVNDLTRTSISFSSPGLRSVKEVGNVDKVY
jgi:hypothetical protein